MIHPATALRYINATIGSGIYATAALPKGTVTWAFDTLDQCFSLEQVLAMSPMQRSAIETYSFVDPNGQYVLCWDHGRFMNHSCEPNVRTVGNFEIAVRDIEPGEELTCDYVSLNISSSFVCACGQPRCRKIIRPSDIEQLADDWDAETRAAARDVLSIPQPLWEIVEANRENLILMEKIRAGCVQELPSCRSRIYRSEAANEAGNGAASGYWSARPSRALSST